MDKSLSRSQSVDERSVELGIDVDGDLVRERSVHGGSREASYRGGGANASASAAMDRSFRNGGGDRNRDRSVHSTSSAVPPSRPPPLPGSGASKGGKEANDDDDDYDEVELGHHRGLSVDARSESSGGGGGGAAGASVPFPPAPAPAPAARAKFYLEEYDHDLYGAPLWVWPRVSRREVFFCFGFEKEGERESDVGILNERRNSKTSENFQLHLHSPHSSSKTQAYFRKMRGGLDIPMPFPEVGFAVLATLGAFFGIACVGGLDAALNRREILESPVLLASFGASAVLLFAVPESKVRGEGRGWGLGVEGKLSLMLPLRARERKEKNFQTKERKKNSTLFILLLLFLLLLPTSPPPTPPP